MNKQAVLLFVLVACYNAYLTKVTSSLDKHKHEIAEEDIPKLEPGINIANYAKEMIQTGQEPSSTSALLYSVSNLVNAIMGPIVANQNVAASSTQAQRGLTSSLNNLLNFFEGCVAGDIRMIDSAFDDTRPKVDLQATSTTIGGFQEYGYSYWFRLLTRYPKPMFQGIDQEWYFMSRLTPNKVYDNVGKGDRLLAVWQGYSEYGFITNDEKTQDWNVVQRIGHEDVDIEGVWTFLHFSYDSVTKQAVGYIKYSGVEPRSLIFDVTHLKPSFLRLVIGGSDLNTYPALNGQFTRVLFSTDSNAHINTLQQLKDIALSCNPEPMQGFQSRIDQVIIKDAQKFEMNQQSFLEYQSNPGALFPLEYGISGWFKWNPATMQVWHLAFRLHINKGNDMLDYQRLGDRTLAAWCSPQYNGIYSFQSYTYQDIHGSGQTNAEDQFQYGNQFNNWHFISYAYSRTLRRAEGYVQFLDRKQPILIEGLNHYLVGQMFLEIGKDRFYPSWNGYIGKFSLHFGNGAFRPVLTQDSNAPPTVMINSFAEVKNTEEGFSTELAEEELPDDVEHSVIPRLIGQNQQQQ